MDINVILWVVLGLVNIPVYMWIGKLLFGSWDGFWEAVGYWFTPDIFSLFQGNLGRDHWAEIKLGVFFILCGACVFGEYILTQKLLMLF